MCEDVCVVCMYVYVGSVAVRFMRPDDVLQRFSYVLCLLEELLKPLEIFCLIQNRLMFSHVSESSQKE